MDFKDAVRKIIDRIDSEKRAFMVSDDESLFDAGVLDSLRMTELICSIEKEYGFRIAPQDLTPDNFDSISRVSSFVARNAESDQS